MNHVPIGVDTDTVAAFHSLEVLAEELGREFGDCPANIAAREMQADAADLLAAGGKAGQAAHMLGDALARWNQSFGATGATALRMRHDEAYHAGKAGRRTEAVERLRHVTADCIRELGPDHRITLFSRMNAASFHSVLGPPRSGRRTPRRPRRHGSRVRPQRR